GEPARFSGELALGTNFWSQRREEIVRYALDNANLRIDASNVNLAPFTAYLPKYLSPQGELKMALNVQSGRKLDGRVEVQGVETRPLPNIGVIQSIRAAVDLKGQVVHIQDLSGVLGGERMRLTGSVDLSPESVAKGYPDIDLAINGSDLPLARNP